MILVEQIIVEYLIKKQIGTFPNQTAQWPIYKGRIPDEPDRCIAIHRESTPTEGRLHRTGQTVQHEGFQVRTRSKDYPEAQKKILEIASLFDSIRREVLSVGTERFRIQCVNQITTSVFIGPDTNDRLNFTLNCTASIQQVTN